jgi:glycosyltransferase involved in cell wall biosynthesis
VETSRGCDDSEFDHDQKVPARCIGTDPSLLRGGGTRIKIIEAAAYGKPIAATRLGAEGLDMRDGHELLLRDDPESFAQACIQLLSDFALCERLGHAAYESVIRHYDRANIISLIQTYLRES